VDWDELLDLEHEWEQIERSPSDLGPIRTTAYRAARRRRVERLRWEIDQGDYRKAAIDIAECILLGRPRWGEALIDDEGLRIDEQGRDSACG
jgi:hypothetical protein